MTYLAENIPGDILGARRSRERPDVPVILAGVPLYLLGVEDPERDVSLLVGAASLLGQLIQLGLYLHFAELDR